jgi:transcriptional regulator with XRE-family HTH domain
MTSQQAKKLLLKKLGKRIRDLRKRKKFFQYIMAKKCDMDYGSYSNIENGKPNVTVFTLQRITKALKISFSELFNF